MSPAEFDTRRRSLGLSVEETAALCGVQDRTVRVWIAARDAANIAATEGWDKPDGGSVTINCYRI